MGCTLAVGCAQAGHESCGCVQVWVLAELDSEGRVKFAAESDSELTRGLAAVLVEALSGLKPEGVLQVCFVNIFGVADAQVNQMST